jgi:hypothetical protein
MKILLVTQEPPLAQDEVVSGNAVRSRQIHQALERSGFDVRQFWLSSDRRRKRSEAATTFRNRDELQGILLRERPAAVIVAYWELLALLPHVEVPPVVLDYLAPRTLEELFESPATVRTSMRRLVANLRKCDLVLVGNGLQRHLLVNMMIEAGFDLRAGVPIRVLPLAAEPAGPPRSAPGDSWVLVGGGVSWPWREAGAFQAELEAFASQQDARVRLVQFGGRYRWHEHSRDGSPAAPAEGRADTSALQPYEQFSRFLSEQAHIGVELAERNVEREYSQSFRAIEFLRHGLPLLCNRYLPIAHLVEEYDAGWLVDEPSSLRSILSAIVSDPEAWKDKSERARALVAAEFDPQRSAAPLVDWLKSPSLPARLETPDEQAREEPVLGVPPIAQRLRRQFGLARMVIRNRLFGQERGPGIVFVTRGDLFPADHGAAVRTVETARALARRGRPVAIVTDDRRHWFEVTSCRYGPGRGVCLAPSSSCSTTPRTCRTATRSCTCR